MGLSAAMPITAAAEQVYAVEFDRQSAAGHDEDFSSVVRAMEQMVDVQRRSLTGNQQKL
jgi:hypothetical protein